MPQLAGTRLGPYDYWIGERPFAGEDVSDTLASVLKSELDWNAVPGTTWAAADFYFVWAQHVCIN